jgi:hypothetical protein
VGCFKLTGRDATPGTEDDGSVPPLSICEERAHQVRPSREDRPRVVFTAAAIGDLWRMGPAAVLWVREKPLVLESDHEAGFPLGVR